MSQHDTPEAVRLADNGGWLDAQSRVPDVLPSVGLSLPVLAIAETDDACFQQTMAIYYSKGRSGMKFPHWRAQRFDDGRDGPVIKVRCWMPRPTFPKNIPGNWNDQPARSAIQAEFAQLEAELDGLNAARFAYASEFGLDDEGQPDVGSIHQNIRELKAERDQLRAELERVRVPEGWRLVPAEPTEAMLDRAVAFALNVHLSSGYGWTQYMRDLWGRLLSGLAAAPTPPHADQKGQ